MLSPSRHWVANKHNLPGGHLWLRAFSQHTHLCHQVSGQHVHDPENRHVRGEKYETPPATKPTIAAATSAGI